VSSEPSGSVLYYGHERRTGIRAICIGLAGLAVVCGLLSTTSDYWATGVCIGSLAGGLAVLALPLALRPRASIRISQDGVELFRGNASSPIAAGRWQDIRNIAWATPTNSYSRYSGRTGFTSVSGPSNAVLEGEPYVSIYQMLNPPNFHPNRYYFLLPNKSGRGKRVVFNTSFEDFKAGETALLDTFTKFWRDLAREELKAGNTVTLGDITLSSEGVSRDDEQSAQKNLIPWEQINLVRIVNSAFGVLQLRGHPRNSDRTVTIDTSLFQLGVVLWMVIGDYRRELRHDRASESDAETSEVQQGD